MKIKVGLLGLLFSTLVLHSQNITWVRDIVVPMEVNLNMTAFVQSPENEEGVIPPPTKYSIGTKSLLSYLAIVENYFGNYPATNFPAGSTLVLMDYPLEYPSPRNRFVVMNAGEVICEVSNVLTFTAKFDYNNFIYTGKLGGRRGLPLLDSFYMPLTQYSGTHIGEIKFSTFPLLGLDFYLDGLVVETGNSVAMPGDNFVTEKWTIKIAQAAGVGLYGNRNMYLTGSISAKGSVEIHPPLIPNTSSGP